MYEAFYGLTSKPFQLNPDPRFYYGSKQHRRAKAYLDYGVERNEGFIVITGEVGAGKTTILAGLLASLDSSKVVVGQLVTTQLEAEDTLRMVGAAFGFRVKDVPKSELLITLEAFLITQASEGKRCLLVVDEAQNLSPRAVEELRMLSNYQLGPQSLLQSFLVGQPEFRNTLQRPEMEQFRQRVAATCHLGPLDLEDTRGYIQHRLKCAGAVGKPEFSEDMYDAIHEATYGVPRRINSLCDRLLLLGYLDNRSTLKVDDVQRVMEEMALEFDASTVRPYAAAAAATAAAAPATARAASASKSDIGLDIDLSKVRLDPGVAERLSRTLTGLSAEQQGDRVLRLERAIQRLEHINLQTLAAVRELIEALRRQPPEDAP
jgi:general secretion pathway protein A